MRGLFAPSPKPRVRNPDYLQPSMDALVERRLKRRRLPAKPMRLEYRGQASLESRLAYSHRTYRTFCKQISDAMAKSGANSGTKLGWFAVPKPTDFGTAIACYPPHPLYSVNKLG